MPPLRVQKADFPFSFPIHPSLWKRKRTQGSETWPVHRPSRWLTFSPSLCKRVSPVMCLSSSLCTLFAIPVPFARLWTERPFASASVDSVFALFTTNQNQRVIMSMGRGHGRKRPPRKGNPENPKMTSPRQCRCRKRSRHSGSDVREELRRCSH